MTSVFRPVCRLPWSYAGHSNLSRRLSTTVGKSRFLQISDEVAEALHNGRPVVALETTIYTHGFPYPSNVELSNHLESVVRQNGAVPATIGVLNGVAKVGMSQLEMDELLEKASRGWETVKLSRRDIGWICGQGVLGKSVNGGTTIAGTIVLSHLAGIKVFATGGLGGVHRGGEVSMDVSADLTELGRTPVALISSGCKSFLDIPRTLEYLETQGVGVGTFADGRGGSVDFPAFWTRDSGVASPRTIQDEVEAAAIIYAQFGLPLSSGLLFANPISEEFSLSKEYMDQVMAQAVSEAAKAGVEGHRNTPYVLDRIRDLTKGSTIAANRELVAANVARGAKVARELVEMESKVNAASSWKNERTDVGQNRSNELERPADLVVAGCLAFDLSGDYTGTRAHLTPQTSNPGRFTEGAGGVGRNIARAASLAGASLRFCSVVGDDSAGKYLVQSTIDMGIDCAAVHTLPGQSTGRYVALNDANKDLFIAMADMSIIENTSQSFDNLWEPPLRSARPKWLALDANWDARTLQKWIKAAKSQGCKIAFEPVSEEKSVRIFGDLSHSHAQSACIHHIDLATPNGRELQAMKNALLLSPNAPPALQELSDATIKAAFSAQGGAFQDKTEWLAMLDVVANAAIVSRQIKTLLVTLGKQGLLLVEDASGKSSPASTVGAAGDLRHGLTISDGAREIHLRHFPSPCPVLDSEIVSVNGAGDTFFGFLLAKLASGSPLDAGLIETAQRAAALTLRSGESVSPEIAKLAN